MRPVRSVFQWRGVWLAKVLDPRDGKVKTRRPFAGSSVPPSKQSRRKAVELAESLVARWQDEVHAGISLRELVELAKRDPGRPTVRDELSEHTTRFRATALARFLEAVGDQPAALSRPIVVQYLERFRQEGRSTETVRRHAAVIRRAYNYAIELGHELRNPVGRLRSESDEERRQRAEGERLTPAQIHRLLRAADDAPAWLYAATVLGLETGLRPGALRGLRWVDVLRDRRVIVVRSKTSKGGAQRAILTPMAEEVLDRLEVVHPHVLTCNGEPLKEWRLGRPFRELLQRAGIHGRSFKSLRHTFALTCADAGVLPHHLKLLLGHGSLTTTEIYLKSQLEEHVPTILDKLKGVS